MSGSATERCVPRDNWSRMSSPDTPSTPTTRGVLDHEFRVRILALLGKGGQSSPVSAAKELELPLGTVAYHFRCLADQGVIAEVATRQRRGTTEHFYGLNKSYDGWPEVLDEAKRKIASLSLDIRALATRTSDRRRAARPLARHVTGTLRPASLRAEQQVGGHQLSLVREPFATRRPSCFER
jgi:hypothetical protein